ncbi:unnamed protein product [Staurois parvus]|uniref:Uncharacterized protein n=1 Tax=Staurois parvus TaxID=386267 RepID=A0ABN9AY37_9NEOB|nr:unnamed protein product [Staurois parvus]
MPLPSMMNLSSLTILLGQLTRCPLSDPDDPVPDCRTWCQARCRAQTSRNLVTRCAHCLAR